MFRKYSKLWLASTSTSSEDSEVSEIPSRLSDPGQLLFYKVSERLPRQCAAQKMAEVPGAFLRKYLKFSLRGYPLWHFHLLNPATLVTLNPDPTVVWTLISWTRVLQMPPKRKLG